MRFVSRLHLDTSDPTTNLSHRSVPLVKPVIRQPKGECEPESDLPCSCPRRTFVDLKEVLPMPATESNRKAFEHYSSSAFKRCKRQH